jgi:hypothetical protein
VLFGTGFRTDVAFRLNCDILRTRSRVVGLPRLLFARAHLCGVAEVSGRAVSAAFFSLPSTTARAPTNSMKRSTRFCVSGLEGIRDRHLIPPGDSRRMLNDCLLTPHFERAAEREKRRERPYQAEEADGPIGHHGAVYVTNNGTSNSGGELLRLVG